MGMMGFLKRLFAIFGIATKRIFSQPWMALATVTGMVFAIALTMSVPLYANSVYNRIFLQQVGLATEGAANSAYPPFTFLFQYDTSSNGNLQWDDIAPINDFFQARTPDYLHLPVKTYERYFATDPMAMFPSEVKQFSSDEEPLLWSSIAMLDDLQNHIEITEGAFPQVQSNGPSEVLITEDLANELGLQVGEQYTLFARDQVVKEIRTTVSVPVKISGVWKPKDPNEPYWFIKPEMFKDRLLVSEDIFAKQVSPLLNNEIYSAFWFIVANAAQVQPEQAMQVVYRIRDFQKQAGLTLPKIKLIVSPEDALFTYQRSANQLTLLLFAFSVPIFGLLLAFITMTAGMTVERQRNEIAVLRSRGAMTIQMVGIAAAESLVLGAAALAVGLPITLLITQAIGHTRSFLDFSSPNGVTISWSPTTLLFGLGAIAISMVARLIPTLQAASSNIVGYKRERARTLRAPLWQRMGLDFILLVPAAYGLYQLRQSGSIDVLGASAKGDPFANPLLIAVPALAIFAASLLFLRVMPLVMSAIAWVAAHTRNLGLMMAARHLARSPSTYTLPLVLLVLTLSLSAFTATLAGTLDHHLYDQIQYRIGADAVFTDMGDNSDQQTASSQPAAASASSGSGQTVNMSAATDTSSSAGWYFLPVEDYNKLDSVVDSTRVGRYQATAQFGSQFDTGELLGVDRYNLPNIAYWRADFARQSLGDLMNQLALAPDGLLVSDTFLANHALTLDDVLTLRIAYNDISKEVDFRIAGTFHLFPTYYPGDATLFVGNLDYIFEAMGVELPYTVWLKTSQPANLQTLSEQAITKIGARTINWKEPVGLIDEEQERPERQGLFGVLSVGFAASALLTVLGFLLYALLSYQRRFVELGVLRAIGLSSGQMIAFLAAELAFLILMGGLVGTGLGVWISNNFIPYLQIGADAQAQIPPYVVYIAWNEILRVYALFGVLFFAALAILVVLLRRMKIFQAIKMGDTV